jgi:tetratricopeptide (TPR) repeat protein
MSGSGVERSPPEFARRERNRGAAWSKVRDGTLLTPVRPSLGLMMPRLSSCPAPLRAAFVAALAAFAALLAGCHDFGDVTGSIPTSSKQPTDDARLRAYAEELGKRYDRNPGEKTASIEYARALRALTRYNEAVAVIQTAAIKAPKDFDVLGEYGKALADAGQLNQAKDVLSHAYTPDDPRWDVMSVQGTVADRLGDHAAAMQFYRDAPRSRRANRACSPIWGSRSLWPDNCPRPRMP